MSEESGFKLIPYIPDMHPAVFPKEKWVLTMRNGNAAFVFGNARLIELAKVVNEAVHAVEALQPEPKQ